MEIDRRELKRQAREAMGLPRPSFRVVALLYILMTTGVNLGVYLITDLTIDPASGFSQTGFFLSQLTLLYRLVAGFGFQLWCLWAFRRQEPGAGSLLQGFSIWGRVLWMYLLIALRVYLILFAVLAAAALLIPPVGVLFAAYPQTAGRLLGMSQILQPWIWAVMLRYSLAPYLLADRPEDGASAAVRRSVAMMRGFKWELAKLELSFLGWELLTVLLSELVTGALLVRAGLLPLLHAGDLEGCMALAAAVSGSTPAYFLVSLVTLPVSLWLLPYRGVARAGFYTARSTLRTDAPPL